jgi:hypothetical protein
MGFESLSWHLTQGDNIYSNRMLFDKNSNTNLEVV